LVKETYDRFVKIYGIGRIYFSTTADLIKPLRKIFPNVPADKFIVEPSRRDTGPAMGFAALILFLKEPDEPMVFAPSDHFVGDLNKFLACFKIGEKLIKETSKMIDIGITATFPSTVLGYTKIGKLYKKINGMEVYNFDGHTEKPNSKTASRYLLSGKYLWHGNYYMWTPRLFLEAIGKYAPIVYQGLMDIKDAWQKKNGRAVATTASASLAVAEIYSRIEKISFDYAVTEKIDKKRVLIIKGDFCWNDIGAWDVLHEQLKSTSDEKGNILKGKIIHHDTENSLLFSHHKKVMAVIGLNDFVVVDTEDALLVCPKSRAQEVKKLIEKMEDEDLSEYL